MRILGAFAICGFLLATILFTPDAHGEFFTLLDETLVDFERTWGTGPPGMGLIEGIEDVEGLGVVYDVGLYGVGGVEVGIGGPSPVSDLSAYDKYVLTFTNLTNDDFFLTCLYLETGEASTFHQSGWQLLAPGFKFEMSLPLNPDWELDDVKEIGFGLRATIGDGIPWANSIVVKAEDREDFQGYPTNPVPEASTLILFGSGLISVLAIARRKLPFLTK